MSIRLKLVFSYIAMLVVPIILSLIAAAIIGIYYSGDIRNTRLGPDFIQKMTEKAVRISGEINGIIGENPDRFKDNHYLNELDKELVIINTGIVVRRNGGIAYISRFLNQPEIYSFLTKYESRHRGDYDTASFEGRVFAIKQRNFNFTDGTPAAVLLVTDIGPLGQFAQNYFSTLGYTILIILILTNGVLTYIVSRSILRPLKGLKHATEEIKYGNLDFKVEAGSRDEIGELCHAFEDMRCKLKQSVEIQLQYEENRKELISSISHDLKTPVTSIKGYVEGIMDGVADTPEKMERYIKTIYTKATDLDRLIEDLFLFSKLDLKKVPFNFEKVNIYDYFSDCAEELQLDLEKKGVGFGMERNLNRNTMAAVDREKLKRVVVNIVTNAVKYMDKENGWVGIKLIDSLGMVTVQIQDNGQGIKKEELPFIFDRFYRGDPSRNTAAGGSGLGLAIARQIVEGHGGKIWAESEYGVGTSIFFTLRKV